MMTYKGYLGMVSYDSDAKIFHGEVVGLNDVITFQGTNVGEIEQAFKDSVDVYIDWCHELGEKPEKSYSGNLRIRLKPHLHAQLAYQAAHRGISLNSYIIQKLQNED